MWWIFDRTVLGYDDDNRRIAGLELVTDVLIYPKDLLNRDDVTKRLCHAGV